jgi:hypothetical protein
MGQVLYLPPAGVVQAPVLPLSPATEQMDGRKSFIEANTLPMTFQEIRDEHIIPVFHRDNEPVISHVDFIETTQEVVGDLFRAERIGNPQIRVSHPIKGRIPQARNKRADELKEWEKTLYYERMAFIIEIPTIRDTIGGEPLSLVVGGVKAYNLDNLGARKGADQHFKVFIGFRVHVCTNMCVWSDGAALDVRVKDLSGLRGAIQQLIGSFDAVEQLCQMEALQDYHLTESQFAHLIGRCRMYQHLPTPSRKHIDELRISDNQINQVCRDYYKDQFFCRAEDGVINLWKLYNLFTGANKSSYIDQFIDRAENASTLFHKLSYCLQKGSRSWFLQ